MPPSLIRVRLAPSPTGYMHLGNIRAALMNYLFAKQKNGTFILRIEDTDQERNVDQATQQILQDLTWLGLKPDEGFGIGGNFGPYCQSERASIYLDALNHLIGRQKVYRCFCTQEQLAAQREKQQAAGKPPRYDRSCRRLSTEKVKQKVAFGKPFIWRFAINDQQIFTITDMAKGNVTFDMHHYADFAITRQDGSVTFTFANFVDDWKMNISHVIRGQDHLANTAYQAALYDAFGLKPPTFWHLPLICNADGKKMSKRDFAFTLSNLKDAGYLPQAILNYLAIIGSSTDKEIQSCQELASSIDFTTIPSGGSIRYSSEKLDWINHQWILKLPDDHFLTYTKPFLHVAFEASKDVSDQELIKLTSLLKKECTTLKEIAKHAAFYFTEPATTTATLFDAIGKQDAITSMDLIATVLDQSLEPAEYTKQLKAHAKTNNLAIKALFTTIRYLLTGQLSGIGVQDLIKVLPIQTIRKRIKQKTTAS